MSLLGPNVKKPTSKTPAVPANGSDRRLENMNPSNPVNQIAALKAKIQNIERQITELKTALEGFRIAGIIVSTKTWGLIGVGEAENILRKARALKATEETRLRALQSSLNSGKNSQDKKSTTTGGPPKSDPPTEENAGTGAQAVIYNAGAVKDAYFKSDQSLFAKQTAKNWYAEGETQIDSYIYAGNTPKSAITNALELWQNSSSGKGMIQTWFPSGKPPGSSGGQTWSNLGAGKTVQRYGFQFLYNPGNISMSYGGVPDVDLTMLTSGTEDYLAANPSVFKSAISFDILLNRMSDIQYLGPGGKLKGDVKASDIYSGKIPTAKDLKKIYNRGTMYDLEFLLQSMFAFSPVSTELRNKTWDVGYLGGFPVEMHLGNKLRYVVLIDSITVNHVIFDHRMVPLFSNLSISARRVPDFKAGVISDAATSSGFNQGTPSNPGAKGSKFNPVVPGGGSLQGGIGIQ